MSEESVADDQVRRPLLLATLLAVLRDAGGPLTAKEAIDRVAARTPFTKRELSVTTTGAGRADNFLRWASGWANAVGWMTKSAAGWQLTEAGRDALEDEPDHDTRYASLTRAYRAVRKAKREASGADAPSAKSARLQAALDLVEPGSWTSYGDLATLTGLANQNVGAFIAATPHPNGHRVLTAEGTVSDGFLWLDPDRTDEPADVLRSEGIEFDEHLRASQAQRLTTYDLAEMLAETGEASAARAWLVRGSNVNGRNLVPTWLARGSCSIAASQIRPLDLPLTRVEIVGIVEADYSQKSYYTRNEKVAELDLFLNRIQIGDVVVTNDGSDFYLGEVDGDAISVRSTDDRSNLRRAVTWVNAAAPVDLNDLPAGVKPQLSSQHPIVDLTGELAALRSLLQRDGAAPPSVPEPSVIELTLADATAVLSDQLLVPRPWLQECIDLLADRRQMIFYGPPGTGKTYLAQAIAAHLTDEPNVKLVQFHPSYSYEDFFEGYRPAPAKDGSGTVGFALTPGPFRRLVDAAREDSSTPYVLIIDEINRANLAKVFGELYFLLEYRDRSIDLLYSTGTEVGFTMPSNVFIIGTMNTADRSIALVDAAMRRRFAFKALHPSTEPTRSVLGKWLTAKGLPDTTARVLDRLNELIKDEDFKIGPSYFMRDSVHSDAGLRLIWETSILPLLEEHHFGEGIDVAKEYGLDRIVKRATSGTDEETAEPTGENARGSDAPSEITNAE